MKSLRHVGLFVTILLAVSILPAGATSAGTKIDFSSLDTSQPYKVSGTLYLPGNAPGPVPAVVLVHGTTGIDMRNEFYREPILSAGIAVFEVDFKTGIYSSAMDRPRMETFVPMAFAALKELRKLPSIDPHRIAIMGFSMGGHISLETAVASNVKRWIGDDKGFMAFVMFYPVCRPFIYELEQSQSKLTGAPMIVFYGTEDAYGEGKAVPEFKSLLAEKYNFNLTTVEYPGATHGFNRNAPAVAYPDPAAIGGRGYMKWNPEAADDSVTKVVAFLRENLAGK
jgi:dienelactone hydrolase